MSERAISDPTEHGWVEVDGKWMWGGSGGGSGSIQDGNTTGQITTWDGTEWTPEGAVVVADGNVDINDGDLTVTSSTNTAIINLNNSIGNYEIANNEFGSIDIKYNGVERFVLASNGDVYITGKLFINGEEVTAGGGGASYTAGNGITIEGDTIKMSGSYSGTFTANTVVGTG